MNYFQHGWKLFCRLLFLGTALASLLGISNAHAQAATQACIDGNVKVHAEVSALHRKEYEGRTTFYPPLFTKVTFEQGMQQLGARIYQHTLALRTANLTSAQCDYMTAYIAQVGTDVIAISKNQFIGVMTVALNTPAPSSLPPAAVAAEDPQLVINRNQYAAIGADVEKAMADARTAGKIVAYDETEFASLKKKLFDRVLATAKTKTLTAADYTSFNLELNAIGSVVYLMRYKTQTAGASGLDPVYYAYKYTDLRQALGTDVQKLKDHWAAFGQKEGRWPNLQTESLNTPAARSGNELSILRLGDVLRSGEYMRSASGQYVLVLQPDANLCVHQASSPAGINGDNRRWCLNKRAFEIGTQYKYYMRVQADGHLCVYRGSSPADQGQGINCAPYGAGGPVGRYFLALQDDGNLAIYKGGGPADNRGYIWDRITTAPSSGFNFAAAVENIAHTVADTTVYAANSLANEVVKAANTIGKNAVIVAGSAYTWAKEEGPVFLAGAQSALKTVQDSSKKVLNTVGERTLDAGVTIGNTISTGAQGATRELLINGRVVGRVLEQGGKIVATQVVAGSDALDFAVATYVPGGKYIVEGKDIIGREIIHQGEVVGREIIKAGVIVGHAVVQGAEFIVEAGKFIFDAVGHCSSLAKMIPGATANLTPSREANDGIACAGQVLAGFMCEIPKVFTQLQAIPAVVQTMAEQSVTAECAPSFAFVPFYPAAPLVCGLGKTLVDEGRKAVECTIAAQRKGLFAKAFSGSGNSSGPVFPSEEACVGIGKVSYLIAETVITKKVGSSIKALKASGKLTTGGKVAEQFLAVKGLVGNVALFDTLTNTLNTTPECNQM